MAELWDQNLPVLLKFTGRSEINFFIFDKFLFKILYFFRILAELSEVLNLL